MTLNEENFKLDFVGIGGQKCATSWLAKILAQHPEICVPEAKELQYFNSWEPFGIKKKFLRYKRGISYYFKFFKNCSNPDIKKGEFSVQYMHEEDVAERIRKTFPETKIIAIIRNPVDRAYSAYHYFKEQYAVQEKSETFKEAVEKHPVEYLERGLYYRKLKKYYDVFPKEQILVLVQEEIKKDPKTALRQTCKFLGVDPDFEFEGAESKVNYAKKRKNKALSKFLFLCFALPDKLERYHLRFISDFISALGVRKLFNRMRKANTVKYTYPLLPQEVRAKLMPYFKEDVEKLQKLLDKDLSSWLR